MYDPHINPFRSTKYKRRRLCSLENTTLRIHSNLIAERDSTKGIFPSYRMLFTKAFVAAAAALSATAHPLSSNSTEETITKRATESVHLVCK